MSNVTWTRPEVEEALPAWTKVRDVVAGETAVKAKTTDYLPKPNPDDASSENSTRYNQYVDRAVFYNATGRTLVGMIGIAYRRFPEIVVPASMEALLDDIDGASGNIINQSHRALEGVLGTGRGGLLVDYPQRNQATSQAEQRLLRINPRVLYYEAENIINWQVENGRLVMVVLFETLEKLAEDRFTVEQVEQWRELRLENGRYVVRLWQKSKSEPVVEEEFSPLDGNGMPWREIPFAFIGAVDNDANIDAAPLFDLAALNIGHYRNSADYEESVYFNGQPTFIIAGLDEMWADKYINDKVYVGSRAAIPLPVNASADLLQADPNSLASEAMVKKERQMIAMGAKLLTPGEAVKTAEQSRSETAAQHSMLSLACDNVSAAYTRALGWAAQFQPATGDAFFAIHTDFTGLVADPQLITALVQGWQAGAFPKGDLWAALRQIGIIDPEKTDDDIAEELDMEGGGLDLGAEDVSSIAA